MYYYDGYQGYGNGCCGNQGNYGYGGAIILVLFILLVIIIGAGTWNRGGNCN